MAGVNAHHQQTLCFACRHEPALGLQPRPSGLNRNVCCQVEPLAGAFLGLIAPQWTGLLPLSVNFFPASGMNSHS
jgi:hypothetical protein